ncbi:hypothetical protein BOTBODRAFT_171476 [Botryobasidium botryosum FD-172 SS1]|uniref:F-box domain-containing protein n=1 Tax=Botryobasidium botryosum (strain FD-172 SS1) TaxID=930990 RepID=A0A067N4I3_BOTB1|nr:hypothetical protein BOTBODRAFT_171476 [Botryobasidium botryosum FD-172 SS1]
MIKLPDELLWIIFSYFPKYTDLQDLRLICHRIDQVLSQLMHRRLIITKKSKSRIVQEIELVQSDLGSGYIQSVRGATLIFPWTQDLDSITGTILLLRRMSSLKYLCFGCPEAREPYCFPPVKPAVRPHFLNQLTHLDLLQSYMAPENLKGARSLSYVGIRRLNSHALELSYIENLVRALADKPIRYFRADINKVTIDLVRLVTYTLPGLVSLVLGFKWTPTQLDSVCPEEFKGSLDELADALSPCQELDRFCSTWFIGRDETITIPIPHHPEILWDNIDGQMCWRSKEPWIINASSRLASACPRLSAIGWTLIVLTDGAVGLGCVRDAATDQWTCSFTPFELADGAMDKYLPNPARYL